MARPDMKRPRPAGWPTVSGSAIVFISARAGRPAGLKPVTVPSREYYPANSFQTAKEEKEVDRSQSRTPFDLG
jgi:hypothetical protein